MQLVTHQQAINSELPSLRRMKDENSIVLSAYVTDFIIETLNFLNLGKTMSDVQVAQTVTFLVEDYPNLNLADLRLFFSRLKKGHYGKFFDRIDGQVILEAFIEYNSERMDTYEHEKQKDHYESKRLEKQNSSLLDEAHPDVIKFLKDAVGEKKLFDSEPKPRTVTEAELFYQRALKQFDNLHNGNDLTNRIYALSTGIRAIKIGNTVFTIQDFINRKMNNIIDAKY